MKFFSQYWIPQYCTILHFTSDRGKIWSFSNHHEIPNCTASGRASTPSWWLSFHIGDIWCTFAGVSPDGDQTSHHQMVIRPLITRWWSDLFSPGLWSDLLSPSAETFQAFDHFNSIWILPSFPSQIFCIDNFPSVSFFHLKFSNLSPTSPRPTSLSHNLWLPGRTVGPVLVVGAVHLLLLLPQLLLLFTFYSSHLQHFSCFSFPDLPKTQSDLAGQFPPLPLLLLLLLVTF